MKTWKDETKKYRKRHVNDFWNLQTQIENHYMDEFRTDSSRK
jgi:hypothetical protein